MFKKYNSIENTYREAYLERIQGHGFWEDEYLVQEKVHGANLSFWSRNGTDFYIAKRNGPIEEGANFYNAELILNENRFKLQEIWEHLKTDFPNLSQLNIFGEVFGGNYPHPDVPKNKVALKVQKGVFYSPDNLFYAFDIHVNGEDYLDVKKANECFEKVGLFYAKTLHEGSIQSCLEYPNEFESTIAKELGLPVLENNICEGVIIRPVRNSRFKNGERIILKNKNEKWSENLKFNKRIKSKAPVPEKVLLLQEALATYATENRLNNVLSKVGEVTEKDFGKLLGAFNKDIITDFAKDYSERLNELEKKERKLVTKSIGKKSATMIRKAIFR